MSPDRAIFDALKKEMGLKTEENDDTSLYKEVSPGEVWLYYGLANANGGPYMGFWVHENLNPQERQNLITGLGKAVADYDCGEVIADDHFIYVCINNPDDSSVKDWIIQLMQAYEGIYRMHREEEENEAYENDAEDEGYSGVAAPAGGYAKPSLAAVPLHVLRVMFGNNNGIIPRSGNIARLSGMNAHESGGLRLLRRMAMMMGYLWIIPLLLLIPFLIPYIGFFFTEPQPTTWDNTANSYVLLKDVSYKMKNLQGVNEEKTIPAGTTVHPIRRYMHRIYFEDTSGNRYYTDSWQEVLRGMETPEEVIAFSNRHENIIYSDKDIANLLIGKPFAEVEARYNYSDPVIVRPDGSKIALFEGISEKKDGKRTDELTLLVDAEGIIRDHAFTGGKTKAGALDYIPGVSKILDLSSSRTFIRNVQSSSLAIKNSQNSINLNFDKINFSDKWYWIIVYVILGCTAAATCLVPLFMAPLFVVMLITLPIPRFSNSAIIGMGKGIGFLFWLAMAVPILMAAEMFFALIITVPSLLLALCSFIPQIERELAGFRCNVCAGWDSYAFTGNMEKGDTYERTTKTTTTYESGYKKEETSKSYSRTDTYEYQCQNCGQGLLRSTHVQW